MGSAFFAPRLPAGLLDRPRLLDRIGGAGAAVTVVHGAAGTGKTTALAQWSRQSTSPVVWVSLGTADAGRFAFWRAVIDRMLGVGLVDDASLLARISPASHVSHTLRDSLTRGFAEVTGGLGLVLDDYHLVADAEADEDLVALLGAVPDLTLVIGTRDGSAFTAPSLRSRVDVALVDHDALALTAAEVGELAARTGVPDDAARDIHALTHGWPLLVRASLIQVADSAGGATRRLRIRGAVERITRSVLDTAEPGLARFILRTSIATAVSPELAAELTGDDAAAVDAHLDAVEAESLGAVHFENGQETLRYHPLLREEFERQLEATAPAEVADLRRRLAAWLSDHGRPLDAVRQAIAVRDWQLLDRIRARHGSTLTLTHPMTYLELLRGIPESVLAENPGLQLSKSLLSVRRDRRMPATIRHVGSALATLSAARHARDDRSDVSRLWNLGVVMILNRLSGRDEGAANGAAQTAALLDTMSTVDLDSSGSYVPLARTHVAITFLHLGDDVEALHNAELALEAAQQYENVWEELHALSLISWIHAARGDIVTARRWVERARAISRPDGWQDAYIGTGYRLAEALLALEEFDADAAERHLRALDFHAPTIEHWPHLLQAEALIALTRGTAAGGSREVAAVVGARRKRSRLAELDHVVVSARTTLDAALGNSAAAHAVDDADAASPTIRVAQARAALVDGQYERAIMLAVADAAATPRLTAELLVIRSLAALRLGSTSTSADALRDASALLSRYGMRQPLLLVPRPLLRAAATNLRETHGIELDLAGVPDRFRTTRDVAALTRRELVVLAELVHTSNLDEIAERLTVSRNTVKAQLGSIYRKLGVNGRGDALVVASELGLLGA